MKGRGAVLFAWLLLCFLTGLAQAEDALQPVPHPDLSEAQPSVREVIERAIRETESAPGADAWGTLGMLYHAHELFDAAQAAYRNALVLAPDDERWLYYLAFLEQQTGKLEAAITRYRRAGERMPDYLPLKVRLGQALLESGDIGTAEALFQSVLEREPDNATALAALGNAAILNREFEAAAGYLEAALAADGAATQLRYPLALAYRQTGATEKAEAQLALAGLEGPALDDPLLESMIRLSQSSRYYITLGFTAAYEGRYQDAETLFHDAVRVNPGDPTAHAALGRMLELSQRFEAALEEFDAALALEPGLVMAAYFKGALLEHLERDAEARQLYQRALDQEPGRAEIRLLLAKSLLRAGDYQQAIAQFERLAQTQGGDATVAYYLGVSRLADGDCAAALVALARSIELGPLYRPGLEAYARTASSCPAADAASRKRAMEVARDLARTGEDPETLQILAMALAANGRFREAVGIQSPLVVAAPDNEFLRLDLERYRDGKAAARPWPEDDPVFAPRRVSTYNR